jgi:antitoxin-like ribbon-helix-helix protein
MSANRNSLQAVLERQAKPTVPPAAEAPSVSAPEPQAQPRAARFYRPSRDGRRLVAGHFEPKVAKQLKLLAAEEETTVQALLEEAIDLLFMKKGQGKIVTGV